MICRIYDIAYGLQQTYIKWKSQTERFRRLNVFLCRRWQTSGVRSLVVFHSFRIVRRCSQHQNGGATVWSTEYWHFTGKMWKLRNKTNYSELKLFKVSAKIFYSDKYFSIVIEKCVKCVNVTLCYFWGYVIKAALHGYISMEFFVVGSFAEIMKGNRKYSMK